MSLPPSEHSEHSENNFEQAKKFFLLGLESFQKELFEDAEKYLFSSLNLLPDRLSTLTNLSAVLIKLNKLEKGNEIISRAIELFPSDGIVFLNQGLLFGKNQNWQMALSSYDKAIKLTHNYAEAYLNRGVALHELKLFEESLASYDKAIEFKSDYAEAYSNRGNVLNDLKRFDESLASYDKAIEFNSDYAEAYYNKSLLLLSLQDFKNGWQLYDWRWKYNNFDSTYLSSNKPKLNNIESACNKQLVVWSEQGVGDQILYTSMFDQLLNISPSSHIFLDERLLPLLHRSFPQGIFMAKSLAIEDIEYDEHLPIADLGKYFRACNSDFDITRNHYLLADHHKAKKIRSSLINNMKYLCGITWSSNAQKIGAEKSIELEDLLPVLCLKDIAFVSLQYENIHKQLADFNRKHNISILECDSVDNFFDLDGHAALIEACDFVITISSTSAHMAGAIGKETYLMCPSGKGLLWYWSNQINGKSLWYPSIHIFEQDVPGQWTDVVQNIKVAIEKKSTENE